MGRSSKRPGIRSLLLPLFLMRDFMEKIDVLLRASMASLSLKRLLMSVSEEQIIASKTLKHRPSTIWKMAHQLTQRSLNVLRTTQMRVEI
jgi:hypothetical protein